MAGFNATAITDPKELAGAVADMPPDVIVLDLQLGLHDGVQQIRTLAAQRFSGALVLISGFDRRVLAATQSLATDLGLRVEAILPKPIRVPELSAILRRLQPAQRCVTPDQVLHAVQQGELGLEFQPIVTRSPNRLHRLEALVRWEHPARGLLWPAEFLPAAESQPEVLGALTDWVVQAAAEAYQVLRELGIEVPIAVNMSTQNLHSADLPDRIASILQASGMPPEDLWLEISERTPFEDLAKATQLLSRMRLKGIGLTLADFGTGYSSLQLLRRIPFSDIKIDRTFVSDLATSMDSHIIVKAIIDLARNMGMGTLAAGVETEQAAVMLEALNVGALQGRLIAPAMPVEQVHPWSLQWTDTQLERAAEQQAHPAEPLREPGVSGREEPVAVEVLSRDDARSGLSARQADVMRLLSAGKSVKEIARQLGLSPGTVKVHLARAYAVLGVHNRVDAVVKSGCLSLPELRQSAVAGPSRSAA